MKGIGKPPSKTNFMHKSKLIIVSASIVVLHLFAAAAGSVSDRISVTAKGEGTELVLIPGLACSSAVWDRTVNHLDGHYRLHIVQVNGFAGAPANANAKGSVI